MRCAVIKLGPLETFTIGSDKTLGLHRFGTLNTMSSSKHLPAKCYSDHDGMPGYLGEHSHKKYKFDCPKTALNVKRCVKNQLNVDVILLKQLQIFIKYIF